MSHAAPFKLGIGVTREGTDIHRVAIDFDGSVLISNRTFPSRDAAELAAMGISAQMTAIFAALGWGSAETPRCSSPQD